MMKGSPMAESSSQFPVLMPVYARADVVFERGEGAYLFDKTGRRYLDFIGGIAVTALGHANPAITAALNEQAKKLWITSNIFHNDQATRLAQRLVELTFADTVFFQNSGVEAWECAIKVARKYASADGHPERYRVITFEGCFHGRTLAAIAASKSEKMVKGFGPMTDGFDLVPWADMDAVRRAVCAETAAVMIEPVQGEGGLRTLPSGFLKELRELCDAKGLLLCFDEIQCGMGRTGKLFAHEWEGVTPDIMCIAKALGNGYPIGACLATARAAKGMTAGTHGSTYGGNPLAAAVGNAVLDAMTRSGFMDDVRRIGEYLWKRLDEAMARHPKIFVEHRGKGMMQGLRCVPPNADVVNAMRSEGLLAVAGGDNVVRFLPSLLLTEAQVDEAVACVDRAAATAA